MTDERAELKRRLVVGRKSDGRCQYDEQAKSELVALCLQPGASVSRLAREFDLNANQLTRWLREHGKAGISRICMVVLPWFSVLAVWGVKSCEPRYFTNSISLPKLSTTSYLTASGAKRWLISSKNLRAHLILVFSISRSSMDDMEPLVSATK